MANLGAKLKGMNWKEFFLDHCEKMGLGLVGLFAVSALGMTSWGTYKTEPEKFMENVSKGKSQFMNSRWPEDRKSEFVARDLGDVVSSVLDGIPANSNYQIPAPFYPRIWTPKEPLSEPKYLKFQELIADGSRVLLQLEPDQPKLGVEVAAADPKERPGEGASTSNNDEVEKPRTPGAGAVGTSPMGAVPITPMPVGAPGAMDPMMGSGYGGNAMAANLAKGYRFASVRAVFPMKEQLAAVRAAMRLESPEQALEHVRFHDFELERQTAAAGPNPWSGKWEKIDIQTAIDVLSKTQFDLDVVDQRYRDSVFTMPLPMRVTSDWKKLASHPQIKRLLTDEEAARQEAKSRAAIEVAEKMKKQAPAPGGFGKVQHDVSGYQRQIQMGDTSMMDMYNNRSQEYSNELMGSSSMPGMQPGMMPQGMGNIGGRNPLVAVPDMLLFRYLDFDVVPGNAYRYRVKLVFKNPLFQRDTSELKQPESAAGEFRYSEWSEPSAPVVIEDDMQVFLAKVNPNPSNTTADFDAFQWMTETGSLIKAPFKKVGRGEQIAAVMTEETTGKNAGRKTGGLECDVLRPAQMSYGKETIEYITPNIVVDIATNGVLAGDEYPDLELGNKRLPNRLDQVVIVNRYGEIVELDNYSQKTGHTRADSQIKTQEENFKDYRQAAPGTPGATSGLEGLVSIAGGESTPGMMPGMEGGPQMPQRRRSAVKKGGSASAGYGSGSAAGMYGSGMGMGSGSAPGMAPGMRGAAPGGGHSAK